MSTSHPEPIKLSEQERQAIRRLFDGAPATFEERFAKLVAIRTAFHEMLGDALGPVFNRYVQEELPRDTIQERNDLAVEVNGRLRMLGLSIQCPRTTLPAILITDRVSPDRPDESRFRLQVRGEDGRRMRTLTSKDIFDLDLMPDPVRVESFARGFKRGDRSGPAR